MSYIPTILKTIDISNTIYNKSGDSIIHKFYTHYHL